MWYDKVQMNTVKQLVHLEIPLIIYCSKRIDGEERTIHDLGGGRGKTTALKSRHLTTRVPIAIKTITKR